MKILIPVFKTELQFLFASLDSAFKILILIFFDIDMHVR